MSNPQLDQVAISIVQLYRLIADDVPNSQQWMAFIMAASTIAMVTPPLIQQADTTANKLRLIADASESASTQLRAIADGLES